MDIRKNYLSTPMDVYEYGRFHRRYIPKEFISAYNLEPLFDNKDYWATSKKTHPPLIQTMLQHSRVMGTWQQADYLLTHHRWLWGKVHTTTRLRGSTGIATKKLRSSHDRLVGKTLRWHNNKVGLNTKKFSHIHARIPTQGFTSISTWRSRSLYLLLPSI